MRTLIKGIARTTGNAVVKKAAVGLIAAAISLGGTATASAANGSEASSGRYCTQSARMYHPGHYVTAAGSFWCSGSPAQMKLTISLFRKRWWGWELLDSQVYRSDGWGNSLNATVAWDCSGDTYTYYEQATGAYNSPSGWRGMGGSASDKRRISC
ncbi:hypothetical protein ACWGCW_25295 [Streptomyces sp. NPDC054933]